MKKRMKWTKTKVLVLLLAVAMLFGGVVGGTLAWLTDTTKKVENVFTVGNIDIELDETKNDFKMVPGSVIAKDPIITVKKDSEACWLFVKIDKANDLDTFISYEMAAGWTQLTGVEGLVFYREVEAATADTPFRVLKGGEKCADGEVTVNNTVTKEQMDALTTSGKLPTLTFTAYAVQKDNVANAATAWGYANS